MCACLNIDVKEAGGEEAGASITPGGYTMHSSADACSVRPTVHASPYRASSMGMTHHFFVFFVPGYFDV